MLSLHCRQTVSPFQDLIEIVNSYPDNPLFSKIRSLGSNKSPLYIFKSRPLLFVHRSSRHCNHASTSSAPVASDKNLLTALERTTLGPLRNACDLNRGARRAGFDRFNSAERCPLRAIEAAIQRWRKYYGKFHKKSGAEKARENRRKIKRGSGRAGPRRSRRVAQENEGDESVIKRIERARTC